MPSQNPVQSNSSASAMGAAAQTPSKTNSEQMVEDKSPDAAMNQIGNFTDPSTLITDTVSKNGNWNEGHESMIKKNLMFGNI